MNPVTQLPRYPRRRGFSNDDASWRRAGRARAADNEVVLRLELRTQPLLIGTNALGEMGSMDD
jgi:hypothetical protein